jgi:hypothetical protein
LAANNLSARAKKKRATAQFGTSHAYTARPVNSTAVLGRSGPSLNWLGALAAPDGAKEFAMKLLLTKSTVLDAARKHEVPDRQISELRRLSDEQFDTLKKVFDLIEQESNEDSIDGDEPKFSCQAERRNWIERSWGG